MAIRQYLATLIGSGTIEDPIRPAWYSTLSAPYPNQIGQAVDADRFNFWIGLLDTDDVQHAALVADTRVRYVPPAILIKQLQDLTAGQRAAIDEVFTWLNLRPVSQTFAATAFVEEILFNLVGHICWHPVAI